MRLAQKMFIVVTLFSIAEPAAFSQSPSLSSVIDNLGSTDSAVRLSAAQNLPMLWQTAANRSGLVSQLTPLLSNPDPHVRLSVLATFEQMVLLYPEEAATISNSKPALLKAIDDPLEDIRQYATAVLGLVRPATDEDLKQVVLRGLADPSHKVRKVALGAVSFRKLNDPKIVAGALDLASSHPNELSNAIETLGDVAPSDPKSIELFVGGLRSKSAETKQHSLIALTKAGKSASTALPIIRQLAEDPNESELIRKSAKQAMKNLEPSTH